MARQLASLSPSQLLQLPQAALKALPAGQQKLVAAMAEVRKMGTAIRNLSNVDLAKLAPTQVAALTAEQVPPMKPLLRRLFGLYNMFTGAKRMVAPTQEEFSKILSSPPAVTNTTTRMQYCCSH